MCFSLAWFENLLIWLVIVVAVVAVLKIFLPWLFSQLGVGAGPLVQIVNIVIWAVVVIFVIVLVFALLACLSGVGHLSLFPR